MPSNRIAYIDNLKGVLILLVVIGHFYSNVTSLDSSHTALVIYNFIYAFHMPLFLFCSGLFAARSFRTGRGFVAENVLLYIALYLIFYLLAFIEDFALGKSPEFNPLYVSSGAWYLLVLALFTVLTPMLAKMKFSWAFLIALLLSVASGLFNEDPTFLSSSRFFTYLPWYVIGFYTTSETVEKVHALVRGASAEHAQSQCDGISGCTSPQDNFQHASRKIILPICALTILAVYFFITFLLPDGPTSLLRRLSTGLHPFYSVEKGMELPTLIMVVCRIAHYALVAVLCACVMVLTPSRKSFLTTIGERTLQIYIVHLLFLYCYRTTSLDAFLLSTIPYWALFGPVIQGAILTIILALPHQPNGWVKQLKQLCSRVMHRGTEPERLGNDL